ncbi:hypothetical protein RIF29_24858 [Crotalaria pallida]|uniref:Uncharacterized protein n=1 Tax=Crotalaria pallida TaxID=3830 RepID=A0AAN9I3M9_CROPI
MARSHTAEPGAAAEPAGVEPAGAEHGAGAEPGAAAEPAGGAEPAAANPQPKRRKSKDKCKPKGQSQPIDYGTLIDIDAANFHSQPLTRSKCKRGGGISLSPTAAKKMKNDKVVYKGSTSRKPSADENQSMTPMNPAELAIYWSELVKEVDATKNGLVEALKKKQRRRFTEEEAKKKKKCRRKGLSIGTEEEKVKHVV